MTAISSPNPQFFAIDGTPLHNGYVWIGAANQNPQTFPIAVYWDAALTQMAVQPLRTIAGAIHRNGTPAAAYTATPYSLTVRDSNMQFVQYAPNSLDFNDVSSLQAELASTAAGKGDEMVASKRSAIAGAIDMTVRKRLDLQTFMADEAGVVGDGATDDTTALAVAIVAAQITGRNLKFRPGSIVKLTSNTVLTGHPITFIGEPEAPRQQGSTRPPVTLRWHGGAAPMFTVTGADWGFVGMAVENFTAATDFIYSTNCQRLHIDRMSFLVGSGAAKFSASIFRSLGNNFGYSRFTNSFFQGAAPYFIYIDGNASPNGLTPIEISHSLFESNSTGNVTVFYLKDDQIDLLSMHHNTFNQQLNELCIIDTTANAGPPVASVISFCHNEIDAAASVTLDRAFRLTYCPNVVFDNNQLQGGGGATALAELVGSTITSCSGNQASSIGGPIFNCDANSRVFPGVNFLNSANTAGIASNPGTGKAGGVLQTVSATFATPAVNATTSYNDTGLTASINLTSESSKVEVTAYINGISVFAASTAISLNLVRNSTQLIEFEKRAGFAGAVTTEHAVGGSGCVYIDAPAAVTTLTYKVQFARIGGSGNVGIAQGGSTCTIVLRELGA